MNKNLYISHLWDYDKKSFKLLAKVNHPIMVIKILENCELMVLENNGEISYLKSDLVKLEARDN